MNRLNSRILLFPLFKDLAVATTGTALEKTTMPLDVTGFRNLLPHAEAVFLLTHTDGLATPDVMEWNVTCFSGFQEEFQPFPSFDVAPSDIDLDGHKRWSDYTTTANFNLDSRLVLWWRNASGVSGVKRATIGAALGVRTAGT